jgi:hypothetical protein
MTTKINTSTIDETFPVPGEDNDTSGFRTNFEQINIQLNQAGTEITELQSYAVLTGTIDNNLTPVTNNLRGSTITNGTYANFHGAVVSQTNDSGSITINVANGSCQVLSLSVDATLSFTNWPAATYHSSRYAVVRIHLTTSPTAPPVGVTILGYTSAGVINATGRFKSTNFPTVLVNVGVTVVIEAWSYDGGSTFFLNYLGEFNASAGS